jgi:hypothetical protein
MHLEDIGRHWEAKIPACTTAFRIRIGSGSRRAKITHKNRKKLNKFHFLKMLDVLF